MVRPVNPVSVSTWSNFFSHKKTFFERSNTVWDTMLMKKALSPQKILSKAIDGRNMVGKEDKSMSKTRIYDSEHTFCSTTQQENPPKLCLHSYKM